MRFQRANDLVVLCSCAFSQLRAVVLNRRGAPPQGGVKKFLGGREPLHDLQHRKFLNGNVSLSNVTPVLILRRYALFGLVPAEMEVGVKYLEILRDELSLHANIQGRN